MRLYQNLVAGVISSVWTALVSLAVVPLYLKYLGIESYGLIGFFATTQILLLLLDLGLAPAINREVARCSASGNIHEAGNLLHTLAIVYWSMAVFIGLVIVVFAPLISQYWLQSRSASHETVAHTLMIMGFVIACRWPIGLYQGVLMGAQRLVVSSAVSIVTATLGSLGAVAVLAWLSPTIQAFFIWQAGVSLLSVAAMHRAAWLTIGVTEVRFDINELKRIWRFSAGMSGVAVFGLILIQADKVLLSRMLSLEDFGRYVLAWAVAGGLYVLISPVFNSVYPRFSVLVSEDKTQQVEALYRYGSRLLGSILFPLGAMIALFSKDLIIVWTGNAELAVTTAPIVTLLTIGTVLHGLMHFPYALQLAYGVVRLTFVLAGALVALFIPLVIVLTLLYGTVGGAAAWLLLNGTYLPVGTWLTHQHLLKGLGLTWLLKDIGVPFMVSIVVFAVGKGLIIKQQLGGTGHLVNLFYGSSFMVSAMVLSLVLTPRFREWVAAKYHKVM